MRMYVPASNLTFYVCLNFFSSGFNVDAVFARFGMYRIRWYFESRRFLTVQKFLGGRACALLLFFPVFVVL